MYLQLFLELPETIWCHQNCVYKKKHHTSCLFSSRSTWVLASYDILPVLLILIRSIYNRWLGVLRKMWQKTYKIIIIRRSYFFSEDNMQILMKYLPLRFRLCQRVCIRCPLQSRYWKLVYLMSLDMANGDPGVDWLWLSLISGMALMDFIILQSLLRGLIACTCTLVGLRGQWVGFKDSLMLLAKSCQKLQYACILKWHINTIRIMILIQTLE